MGDSGSRRGSMTTPRPGDAMLLGTRSGSLPFIERSRGCRLIPTHAAWSTRTGTVTLEPPRKTQIAGRAAAII
jgi:hypothetical protein